MSVKSVAGSFVSFLRYHGQDLAALDVALSGILQALPVNAETRSHIQDAIDKVRDSAVNVTNAVTAAVEGFDHGDGGELAPVTIKRSDIDAAVTDVLPAAIADYFRDHPTPVDPAPAPGTNAALDRSVETRTATASEETARSQAGTDGSGDQTDASDAGAFAGDTTVKP